MDKHIMKRYITVIALITGLYVNANAQSEVKVSFRYLPQRHYLSKISMNVNGSVNVQGSSPITDSLKAKGIPQNMNVALNASGDIDINTGAESGGSVPVTMRLDNITAKPVFNGQQIPFVPVALLEGKMLYAKASADGQLHIDSVSGKHLPDSVLNRINGMISMVMNRMQLPKRTFRVGDSFTEDIPMNLPMAKGMAPANATSKVTYRLTKIEGGKAYFDIVQASNFTDDKHNMHGVFTGNGTGKMVYDIKEKYPEAFTSNMKINFHATGNDKGAADAAFTIVSNGTTSLSRQ
jgi:hypothetical protein